MGILYDCLGIDNSGYIGIVHGYVLAYESSLGMFNVLRMFMMQKLMMKVKLMDSCFWV